MRGRKPKPRQLHLVDGTYRPDRHDTDCAEPSGEAPPCPPFLRGTARKEWDRIVPQLERAGILDQVDQAALAVYCQARSDYSWAVYKLRREGRIVVNPKSGLARAHPAIRVQRESAETIRKFAVEFGLTPSARSRIRVPRDDDDPEDNGWFE